MEGKNQHKQTKRNINHYSTLSFVILTPTLSLPPPCCII